MAIRRESQSSGYWLSLAMADPHLVVHPPPSGGRATLNRSDTPKSVPLVGLRANILVLFRGIPGKAPPGARFRFSRATSVFFSAGNQATGVGVDTILSAAVVVSHAVSDGEGTPCQEKCSLAAEGSAGDSNPGSHLLAVSRRPPGSLSPQTESRSRGRPSPSRCCARRQTARGHSPGSRRPPRDSGGARQSSPSTSLGSSAARIRRARPRPWLPVCRSR